MNKEKALVVLSGGQDSTTCLFLAKKQFKEVFAIGFDYGQIHKKELEQAKKICKDAKVDFKVIDIRGVFNKSTLISGGDHNLKSEVNKELPASFVAGRNIIFLTIAGSYSAGKGIKNIFTGVSQEDYSGYPDCHRNTITAIELSLSLGLGIGDIKIHTPLMYISKAETWKLAKELDCLDVIINDTLTDYNGDTTMNEWGMGKLDNPASNMRAKSFYEAKKKGWL